MIYYLGQGRSKLEFGTGDINISAHYLIEEGQKIGCVGFRIQSPREMGGNGDNASDVNMLEDLPVLMTFKKSESIDVLIKALEEAKFRMLDEEEAE